MAALLRNSTQNAVNKVIKDNRYYEDVSRDQTQRENLAFLSGAIEAEGSRVNIEAHPVYSLEEAKRVLNEHVQATYTGKMLNSLVSPQVPKNNVPRHKSGYIANSMFRPRSAPPPVLTPYPQRQMPVGPGRRGSNSE